MQLNSALVVSAKSTAGWPAPPI